MGSPQNPTQEQIKQLEAAGQLKLHTSSQWVEINNGQISIDMDLPRQGISLIKLDW